MKERSYAKCQPPGKQQQKYHQQAGNALRKSPSEVVPALPTLQHAEEKTCPKATAMGEIIHIFSACSQHGDKSHASSQWNKRLFPLVKCCNAAQSAEARKESRGKAQTYESMLTKKVISRIADTPTQQTDQQCMSCSGGTRQQW